jgi:hypothetical protein
MLIGVNGLEQPRSPGRAGALSCTLNGDRVNIADHAVLYLEGAIEV